MFWLLIWNLGFRFEHYHLKFHGLLNWNWQVCLISSHGQENQVICSQRLWSLSIQLQSAPIYKKIKVRPPKLYMIRTSIILPLYRLSSMTTITITSIASLRLFFLILRIRTDRTANFLLFPSVYRSLILWASRTYYKVLRDESWIWRRSSFNSNLSAACLVQFQSPISYRPKFFILLHSNTNSFSMLWFKYLVDQAKWIRSR